MRRLFLLIVVTVLLAGCTQTEGRYEIVPQSQGSAWLVDRQTGCVWIFVAVSDGPEGFVPIPVKELHKGEFGKKAEGCTKGG